MYDMKHELIYYYLKCSKNNRDENLINAIELDHKNKCYTLLKRVEDLAVDSVDENDDYCYDFSCVSKTVYDMLLSSLRKSDWKYKRHID